MEFFQFHPTCLYHPHAKTFLISEALRGEGGLLKLPDGTRFMPQHDARAELAPRDIVARAIDFEIKKRGADCVYLDITHKPADFVREHFPTIYARCLEFGIDMTKQPIPVVPAAHYMCGGVDDRSRRPHRHRSAVGDRRDGVHRAARREPPRLQLAARRPGVRTRRRARHPRAARAAPPATLPEWDESRVTNADEEVVVSHNWDELRRFMWNYVGIVRTDKRLERAAHRIELLKEEIDEYYWNFRVTSDLVELRNLAQTAELIVRSAQARKESRGLHYSRDYPDLLPTAENTVLSTGVARPPLRQKSIVDSGPRPVDGPSTPRRSRSACASVPLSTYSSSPPTGTPRASRLTAEAARAQQLAQMMRGRLALDGEVGREHDLAHDAVGRALQQPLDVDVARADAVERRQSSHQHEVEARVRLRLLDHQQVGGRFDDAQQRRIAPRRRADRAELGLGERVAALAVPDVGQRASAAPRPAACRRAGRAAAGAATSAARPWGRRPAGSAAPGSARRAS